MTLARNCIVMLKLKDEILFKHVLLFAFKWAEDVYVFCSITRLLASSSHLLFRFDLLKENVCASFYDIFSHWTWWCLLHSLWLIILLILRKSDEDLSFSLVVDLETERGTPSSHAAPVRSHRLCFQHWRRFFRWARTDLRINVTVMIVTVVQESYAALYTPQAWWQFQTR